MSKEPKQWGDAQKFCVEREGELVQITSFEENEYVLKLVKKREPSLERVWIGLKYNQEVKKFLWSITQFHTSGTGRTPLNGEETLVNLASTCSLRASSNNARLRVPGMMSPVSLSMDLCARSCNNWANALK